MWPSLGTGFEWSATRLSASIDETRQFGVGRVRGLLTLQWLNAERETGTSRLVPLESLES